ncbi:MAG: hypothetical protein M0P31_17705 [Solirubrobacteraceae bacterium]|nr:hypothetical protein [Solirubrobacteraceae bacterium]
MPVRSLLVLVASVMAGLVLSAPASAASCGSVTTPIGVKLQLTTSGTSCSKGRSVIQAYYAAARRGACSGSACTTSVSGFRCATNTSAAERRTGISTTCSRGSATVRTKTKAKSSSCRMTGHLSDNIRALRPRGVSCVTARKVVRGYTSGRQRFKAGGRRWTCTSRQTGYERGAVSCKAGSRRVTFTTQS